MFRFDTHDQEHETLNRMEESGGSFVKSLAHTYRMADIKNRLLLLDVFGNYFLDYTKDFRAIKKDAATKVYLSMTDNDDGHHLSVTVAGTPQKIEHLFTHLIADHENKLGGVLRTLMSRGIPMSEKEAREVLGDDIVDSLQEDEKPKGRTIH